MNNLWPANIPNETYEQWLARMWDEIRIAREGRQALTAAVENYFIGLEDECKWMYRENEEPK